MALEECRAGGVWGRRTVAPEECGPEECGAG